MSRNIDTSIFLSRRRDIGRTPTKYNLRGATPFQTLSPNYSSSSDSFEDSFEQLCKPLKQRIQKNPVPSEGDSMFPLPSDSICARNDEECKELDEMFKNIDLQDTGDTIPIEWLDGTKLPMPNCAKVLSTVYEGSESKYCSTKSISSSISKDSQRLELSQDSLMNVVKTTETSQDSLERSCVANSKEIEPNDTLEDVEYVCDEKNRYLLKPVPKTLPSILTPHSTSPDTSVIVIDSSPETSFTTAQSFIDVNKIKTEILSENSLPYGTIKSEDSDKDISLAPTISSMSLSFTTARNDLKLIDVDDIKSEISEKSSSGKTDSWSTLDVSQNSETAPMVDKKSDNSKSSGSAKNQSDILSESPMFTCVSYPKTASFFDTDQDSDIGKASEYYTAAVNTSSGSSTSQLSVSEARYNTLDDVPSFSTDSAVSSFNPSNGPQNISTDSSKHFNDSLERIEYMMNKGRELQEKSNTKSDEPLVAPHNTPNSKKLTSSAQKHTLATASSKTPIAKAKLAAKLTKKPVLPSPQAITPGTRILKPFNRPPVQSTKSQPAERKFTSPRASPGISPAFKKPNFPTGSGSRIPSATKNKNFDHIVSPIGAYINNIAPPPLLANVKPTSEFFDSSYCTKMSRELDNSVASNSGVKSKPVPSLPIKFFTSSEQQRVIDAKYQKIPCGEKMNRIIGKIPTVISHQGRIHSGSPVKRNVPIDDSSFANVSIMSGDISVQVVKDVKRK
ncbi:hypothetical protein Bhyg_01669 [Pseudolycoriella hygida]|uniref:Uncharacterized protein n=1 Tax=Pseudolycoriella hygida TaxID=35572 RepID=A0A9Q0N9Z9_9DIPT|nr:hypothetical protein Bhyg_01669 [Pseudolycoriella hygida]